MRVVCDKSLENIRDGATNIKYIKMI